MVTDPAEVAQYAHRIGRQTQRLGGMVDDLFQLSRISFGALRLTLSAPPEPATGRRVCVDDACGGIPEQHLDRVFDVAFRGHTACTPASADESGAGLGLAIARAA